MLSFPRAMQLLQVASILTLGVANALGRAPAGPWDNFNYAPKTKTVYPTAIHSTQGSVTNAKNLILNAGSATISTKGSWLALDYGVEVNKYDRLFFQLKPNYFGHRLEVSFR